MPPSSHDERIVEGVAIGNLKSIAEQPAMLSNLAYSNIVANTNLSAQNAVANQQSMNELGVAVTAKTTAGVTNLGPLEARSAVDILTNNEVAQGILDLKASLSAFAGGGGTTGGGGKKKGPLGSRSNPLPANGKFFAQNPVEIIAENITNPADADVTKTSDGKGNTIVTIKKI